MKPLLRWLAWVALWLAFAFSASLLVRESRAAVPSPTAWLQYATTTVPQTLQVTFVFGSATDILVLDSATSPPAVLTLNSDYSVSGGAGSTGTIATIAGGTHAVKAGDVITISRAVPLTQTTSFSAGGPVTPTMLANAFDKLTEIAQQQNLVGGNSLQFQADEQTSGVLPRNARKNSLLGFDANGGVNLVPIPTATPGDASADLVTSTGSTTARALATRFAEFKNVRDYGAKGDGLTNDSSAVTAALAAAGAGGVVYFPPGTYLLTAGPIAVPADDVTILGSGWGTKLVGASATDYRRFGFTARTKGAVEGITFDGLYAGGATASGLAAVEVTNSVDVSIRRCRFDNIMESGVYFYGDCQRCSVEGCSFSANYCSIFSNDDGATKQPVELRIVGNSFRAGIGSTSASLSGAIKISAGNVGTVNSYAGHSIVGNTIDAPGEMGIELFGYPNGTTISGNTISGAGFGVSVSAATDVTVAGNVVKNSQTYGIELASAATRCAVVGNTIDQGNASGTANSSEALIVGNSTRCSVTGNSIYAGGVHVQSSSSVTIASNVITPLAGVAINLQGAQLVAVVGNAITAPSTAVNTGVLIDVSAGSGTYYGFRISENVFKGTFGFSIARILSTSGSGVVQSVTIANNDTSNAGSSGTAFDIVLAGSTSSTSQVFVRDNSANADSGFPQDWLDQPVAEISDDETLSPRQNVVLVDASGANRTETLPSANAAFGRRPITIKKIDSSGNTVTVVGTIDGAANKVLSAQYKFVTLAPFDGAWYVTASN